MQLTQYHKKKIYNLKEKSDEYKTRKIKRQTTKMYSLH